jgi:thiosulfate dehydrogenase [quinone] large subunit
MAKVETEKAERTRKEGSLMRSNTGWRHYSPSEIPEPPLARFLFADTRMAWFWLLVRLYAGWQWFVAGFEKLTGVSLDFSSFGTSVGPRWVFTPTSGAAMHGFVLSALGRAGGAHPAVQGWYANFLRTFVLPNTGLFAYLITFGELLVGLGILVGALTGIAAFFGLVMNFNYLLSGTVSTNPILGACGLFLMLAWRIAGYWGLDRWLLPLLGTPWTGSLKERDQRPSSEPESEQPPTGALPT